MNVEAGAPKTNRRQGVPSGAAASLQALVELAKPTLCRRIGALATI